MKTAQYHTRDRQQDHRSIFTDDALTKALHTKFIRCLNIWTHTSCHLPHAHHESASVYTTDGRRPQTSACNPPTMLASLAGGLSIATWPVEDVGLSISALFPASFVLRVFPQESLKPVFYQHIKAVKCSVVALCVSCVG